MKFKQPLLYTIVLLLSTSHYLLAAGISEVPKLTDRQREDCAKIIKYTSASKQYLIDGAPIIYSHEELSRATQFPGIDIPELRKSCLNAVNSYIYAFPGYKYESISVKAMNAMYSQKHFKNKNYNVFLFIEGKGLTSNAIATENGKQYGESHEFELDYNETNKECRIISFHFFNWIIPRKVYNNAVSLALEHPVVKNFIKSSEQYDLWFGEWVDDYKGKGTNYERALTDINFRRPIKGIIALILSNNKYYQLHVYVDAFNGDIFSVGPCYNPPR